MGGFAFYHAQAKEMQKNAEDELASIAQIKVSQISLWIEDQMEDATDYAADSPLRQSLLRYMGDPSAANRGDLLLHFKSIVRQNESIDVVLMSSVGEQLLSLNGHTENDNAFRTAFHAVLQNHRPEIITLHLQDMDTLSPELGVVAPVYQDIDTDSNLMGALVTVLNPEQFLYPLIQSWPTSSKSAETLLIRKSSQKAEYLNDLRHRPKTALTFKMDVAKSEHVAVKAINGQRGIVTGLDYRNVLTTAYILPVPNSEMLLISKIDSDEIYAHWHKHSGFILVLIAVLFGLGVVGGFMLWQIKLKKHFQNLYESELAYSTESERHSVMMHAIGDGVISTDTKGFIEFMNPAAEVLAGWKGSEALGKSITDVYKIISRDTRESPPHPVLLALDDKKPVTAVEYPLLLTRDGREIPITDNAAPIFDNSGKIIGAVLSFRDRTEDQRSHLLLQLRVLLHDYATTHTIDELLVKTLDEMCAYTDSPIGFYHFVEEDQETILLQQWSTQTRAIYCHAEGEQIHYPVSSAGIWADSIRQKRPIIHNDYASLPNKKGLPEGHAELTREMVIPIIRNDHVVAVFGIGNRETEYSEDDLESIGYLGDITWNIIAQKRADSRIRNFANNWSKTFDASDDAIALLDSDQKIQQSNEAFKKLFNKTDQEINFHYCYHIVHACDEPLSYCPFIEMQASNQRESIEMEMNDRIFRVVADPIWSDDGELTGAVHVISDITAQVNAARRLEESEEKFRNLVEASPDALYIQINGFIQYANAAALKLFEVSDLKDFINTPVMDLIHPDFHHLMRERVENITKHKRQVPLIEEKMISRKGRVFDAEVATTSISLDREVGVQVIVRDISARKKSEAALQLQNQQLDLIYSSVADGIFSLTVEAGPRFRFESVNPAFLKMTGAHSEEVLGQTLANVIPQASLNQFRANLEKAIEEKQTVIWEENFNLRVGQKSGVVSVSPVFSITGRCTHMIGSFQDITDRKLAEAEHDKLQDQLAQSQKLEAVGRLAGGVAHDYNNMLSVISGHAEMALERLEQKQTVEADLKGILRATYRSAEITRQLLTFARQQAIHPQSLELNYAIEQSVEMLHRLINEEIDLEWNPGEEIWSVKIDPSQIDQILTNLCVNARDAISGVGQIKISTRNIVSDESFCAEHPGSSPGDYVSISVSDNGIGMDTATAEQIFEPFFTTKEVGKGTGLGLATVYGIVKQNDGFITVDSEPGFGTTFTIYLPRFKGLTAKQMLQDSGTVRSSHGETILIVEDEREVLEMTKAILTSLGYRVIAVGRPRDALALLETEKQHKIDLLLTDVVMPEMNGREFSTSVQELYPRIKVVFMSGYPANVIAHRGVLDDGVNFIQKPFTVQALASKLRIVLDTVPDVW